MQICGPKQSRFMRAEIIYEDCYGLRHFYPDFFKNVLDVGANVGYFSMMCRFLFPKARIISIEPQKEVFEALSKNAIYLDIEPHRSALGDGTPVYLIPRHHGTWATRYDKDGDANSDRVDGKTLVQLVQEHSIDPAQAFLKIDCEGAERHLLNDKGAEEFLKNVAAGAMEVHSIPGGMDLREFEKWLNSTIQETHDIKWGEFRTDRDGRERITHVKFVRKDVPLMNDLTVPPTKVAGISPKDRFKD